MNSLDSNKRLPDISDLLEIWIPTYNRAEKLRWILEDLANSSFYNCTISISDNASTDATEQLCSAYRTRLPNVRYNKLEFNIGANANILDGLRKVKAPYFWVVCDDDRLHLDGFAEQFISLIEQDPSAIILVGDPFLQGEPDPLVSGFGGKVIPFNKAIEANPNLVSTMSFLPAVIYKRAELASRSLYWGYSNCAFLYPHMPLISDLANRNVNIGISKHVVVHAGFDVPPFSAPKRYWLAWCHSCRFLADPNTRLYSKWAVLGGRNINSAFKAIRNLLIWDLLSPDEVWHTMGPLKSLPQGVYLGYILGQLLLAPLRLVPQSLFIFLLKKFLAPNRLDFLKNINEFAS